MVGLEVGGVTLATSSLTGEAAMAGGGYLPGLVEALGREVEDLSTAFAQDPAGQLPLVVFAVKVKDVTSPDLLNAFKAVAQVEDAQSAVVGGKQVLQIPTQWPSYAYTNGDVLLILQTPDDALAQEALSKLP